MDFGFKIERNATIISTINGGKSELIGGLAYVTLDPVATPMFKIKDSKVSISGFGELGSEGVHYTTIVEETRGNDIRTLARGAIPLNESNGTSLALYAGYKGSNPKIDTISASKLLASENNGNVVLTWHPSSDVTATNGSYIIKRALRSDTNYSIIATGIKDTAYTDIIATNHQIYKYVVTATSGGKDSLNSNQVMVSGGGLQGNYYPILNATINAWEVADSNGGWPHDQELDGINSTSNWFKYSGINFGMVSLKKLNINLTVPDGNEGRTIEVRLDSLSGSIIGSLVTKSTGGWNNFEWQSADLISSPTGVHDVFITFSGINNGKGIANIHQIGFNNGELNTPPSVPSNLQVTPGVGSAKLVWKASNNATTYTIMRTLGDGYTPIIEGLTTTEFEDINLSNMVQYGYVVVAFSSGGSRSDSSNQIGIIPDFKYKH